MRWNCPHCRIGLEASDDQISSAWSFSLCSECKRFGLVRGSSPVAVKVDRAPAGEKFIRASRSDVTMPIVKPAQPRKREPEKVAVTPIAVAPKETVTPAPKTLQIRLPSPLPEIPQKRGSFFPAFVMLSCLGILAWNAYRYLGIAEDRKVPNISDVSDRVTSKAMAPTRIDLGAQVQARADSMQIRNGPGIQFPVIGVLNPSHRYTVIASEDQWYQIQAGTSTPAWVSSDEVNPAN